MFFCMGKPDENPWGQHLLRPICISSNQRVFLRHCDFHEFLAKTSSESLVGTDSTRLISTIAVRGF